MSLFVNAAAGDLHLVPTASPAIDQGAVVAAGVADGDIDGQAREASRRDIGADEYLPMRVPAGEGIVLVSVASSIAVRP
jgi:hypothetical protein